MWFCDFHSLKEAHLSAFQKITDPSPSKASSTLWVCEWSANQNERAICDWNPIVHSLAFSMACAQRNSPRFTIIKNGSWAWLRIRLFKVVLSQHCPELVSRFFNWSVALSVLASVLRHQGYFNSAPPTFLWFRLIVNWVSGCPLGFVGLV